MSMISNDNDNDFNARKMKNYNENNSINESGFDDERCGALIDLMKVV